MDEITQRVEGLAQMVKDQMVTLRATRIELLEVRCDLGIANDQIATMRHTCARQRHDLEIAVARAEHAEAEIARLKAAQQPTEISLPDLFNPAVTERRKVRRNLENPIPA